MSAPPDVRAATQSDKAKVIQTITLGFIADPVARWIWPDATTYLEVMPKFARSFGGRAFDHDTAYFADDCKAAALWLPPCEEPDGETIETLLEESVSPDVQEDAASFFAQMDEFHPQDEPCWYLPMIAADPAYVGRGLGAALMKHALRRCDKEGITAYLESSNPRNISLYERHGFEVIGTIQAGSSPPMYPMIRRARR